MHSWLLYRTQHRAELPISFPLSPQTIIIARMLSSGRVGRNETRYRSARWSIALAHARTRPQRSARARNDPWPRRQTGAPTTQPTLRAKKDRLNYECTVCPSVRQRPAGSPPARYLPVTDRARFNIIRNVRACAKLTAENYLSTFTERARQ